MTGRLIALSPAPDGGYTGAGRLDFHGVTGALEGMVRVTLNDEEEVVIEGSAGLDVTDFGIRPPSLLMVKLHPQVRVELTAVATPDP